MRIAVLTSSYPRYAGDGTAPFVQSICEHLAKLGHEIEVVAPYDPAVDDQLSSKFPVHRFRYIWPDKLHIMGHAKALEADTHLRLLAYLLLPFFLISAFGKLCSIVWRQRTQLIHAHWVLPNGPVAALVAKLNGIPYVISLHGSDMYMAREHRLFGAVAKWVFQGAASVTACSEGLKQSAIQVGSPHEPRLISWGADPNLFQPHPKPGYLMKELGLSKNQISILALGRMVHKKGFDVLLTAWPMVSQAFPNAQLIIAGEGLLRKLLMKQAKQMGVIFPGQIPWDQVPHYFALADLFVLPSVQDSYGNIDGQPTVLLEAMSCGLAVVASRIGGMPEVIRHDHNGILVPPGDETALAKAMTNLLQNPAIMKRLGRNARLSVTNSLHWDKVAEAFSAIFDDII